MGNVTNAYDAHKQVEDYIDDALNALDSAESVLSKINFNDSDSVESDVADAIDKITDAIFALRG